MSPFMVEISRHCKHPERVNHLAKAREVFDIELAALKAVRALLDKSFDRAVETVVEALKQRGKIVIVGIGKSGYVGAKIRMFGGQPADNGLNLGHGLCFGLSGHRAALN